MKSALVTACAIGAAVFTGCGGDGDTTVVKPQTVTETTTTTGAPNPAPTSEPAPTPEPTPAPAPEPAPQEPPNVVGLALPDAKKLLSEAGFSTSVKNTDTTFGIIVPENYTVCTQGKPRGTLVPILAQKYGC
jgi:pyruvate/2-oxoglutarate dehydrogenase complex dihydrolipoamide acyltransferase (E2) component